MCNYANNKVRQKFMNMFIFMYTYVLTEIN